MTIRMGSFFVAVNVIPLLSHVAFGNHRGEFHAQLAQHGKFNRMANRIFQLSCPQANVYQGVYFLLFIAAHLATKNSAEIGCLLRKGTPNVHAFPQVFGTLLVTKTHDIWNTKI